MVVAACIGTLAVWVIGMLMGRDSVYEDAIAHGAGEWVTTDGGAVVWKWKTFDNQAQ